MTLYGRCIRASGQQGKNYTGIEGSASMKSAEEYGVWTHFGDEISGILHFQGEYQVYRTKNEGHRFESVFGSETIAGKTGTVQGFLLNHASGV